MLLLTAWICRAQDSLQHGFCGLNRPGQDSLTVTAPFTGATAALTAPGAFPASAIDTCGKFILYYEDRRTGAPAGGFSDTGGIGLARRNTMCAVFSYVQSVFDFSGLNTAAGEYIRIHVDTSYSKSYTFSSSYWASTLGNATPFFPSSSLVAGAYENGFVHRFVTSGTDPNPGDYHANMRMNFRAFKPEMFDFSRRLSPPSSMEPSFNNGTGMPTPMQYDLYSELLHFVSHLLGWFSWQDVGGAHGVSSTRLPVSFYDTSLHIIPDPMVTLSPFDSIRHLIGFVKPPTGKMYFAVGNGKRPPHNFFVYNTDNAATTTDYSHVVWGIYSLYHRLTPGDYQPSVMYSWIREGNSIRTYSKQDIETFRDIIRLPLNPTFSAASTTLLTNNIPWSKRMNSDAYRAIFPDSSVSELLPADYTLKNDSGATLTINLGLDTTLMDEDGDTLSVYPGSLVNFRGCGNPGNNHDLVVLSNSNRTITFSPRHNFYGRAHFGFNLYDGKEKGGFVVYTINVTKGNNVSAPKGSNMILNGDFEAGTEVKTLTDSLVNNTFINGPMLYALIGRLNGTHLSDGYPYICKSNYAYGTCIRGSYHENSDGVLPAFGMAPSSFPWTWPGSSFYIWPFALKSDGLPDAKVMPSGSNNRYQPLGAEGLLIQLADTLKQCKRYVIEFDAIRTYKPGSTVSGGYTYPVKDSLTLGFTNTSLVDGLLSTPWPGGSKSFRTDSISTSGWQHFKFSFGYCGSETIDMLQLRIAGAKATNECIATTAIDNLSLTEVDLANVVKITDSATGGCKSYLLAGPPSTGCPSMTYEWKNASGTVVSTNRVLPVITWDTTFYSVSVSDGCSSAKDTFRVVPCSCSPAKVFKTSSYTPLSGSISGSLAPGYYHARGDLSMSSSLTFDNVQMLMEPGVKISVVGNAVLTLDSSHLFVCPDTSKLWKGIDLTSGGGYSGRITVKSHSLIEDADTAIRAVNPITPASGYMVSIDSAVFNRNVVSLLMDNYTAVTSDTTYPVLVQNAAFVSRKFTKTGSTYPLSWPDYYSLRAPISNGAKPPFAVHNDYDPVWTKNGKSAVAGIMLRGIGTYSGSKYYRIRVGNVGGTIDSFRANLFDNTSAGIYAERTNLVSWNNYFINMQQPDLPATGGIPPPPKIYMGCGIYAAAGGSGQYLLSVVQPPINTNAPNKFFDCITGIQASDFYDTYIQRCRIASSNNATNTPAFYGVNITNLKNLYGNVVISDNVMGNIPTAIFLRPNKPNANRSTHIELNTLSATHPWMSGGSTSGQYMQQAISVQGMSSATSSTPADTAVIANNNLSGVYNGIEVTGMAAIRALVENNTISMRLNGTAKAQYGIYIGSTQKGTVQNNILSGDGSTKSSDKIRAVFAAFNTDLRVCVNSTTNIGRGFDFGLTRPQTGIRWYGNSMSNGVYGFILGSDVGNLNSEIDFMTHVPPLGYGAGLNTWSGYTGGTSFETFGENLRDTRLSKLYFRSSYATETPSHNSGSPVVPPYIFYSSSLMATDYTSSCLGSSHFPSRYYPLSRLRSVGPSLAMLVLADSLGYGQDGKPAQWMAQLSLYEAGLIDPSLSDSFPTFATFMTQAAGSRFGWVTSVQQALADGDVETAADLISYQPSATGFIPVDTDVSISDYTEADTVVDNYASYFNYYLSYLTGTFTDTAGLQLLALKCPSVDGAAVFMARTLLGIVNGVHVVYDDDGCNRSSASSFYRIADNQEVKGSAAYSLYPNPNTGSFSLVQYVPNAETVPVKVYNALGMVVYTSNLTFNNGRSDIRLTNAVPGVYLVCIGNGQSTCLRFVVH
ncbi:T9SS type A sorting domain-containing protein [Rurimicrobium arvi]|uniref:Secretion system C-terminal sorting domain-containing protein n=1 Tax=Rurimicrobium arvi TaxID=2049916 RepID=A0ABP8MZ63_9BACT